MGKWVSSFYVFIRWCIYVFIKRIWRIGLTVFIPYIPIGIKGFCVVFIGVYIIQ